MLLLAASLRAADGDVTFFAIGDPQINIPRWGTAGTEATIDAMNLAPAEEFPFGGKVGVPRGVLIAGDLVDDLRNSENWKLYRTFFDPLGKARLRFPVYEGVGNHDLDSRGTDGSLSVIEAELVRRNRARPAELHLCERGFHYSWDWGPLHLVNLNVFPGNVPRPVYGRDSSWNDPRRSLEFLERDLRERVGASGRPVILMWHYGLEGWGLEMWWKSEDLLELRRVLAPYNIALLLHGHEHAYRKYRWDGHDVLMAPAPQRDRDPKRPDTVSRPKGFVVIRLRGDELQVAHRDAGEWKERWSKKLDLGAPPSPRPQAQRELPRMLSIDWSTAPPLPRGMQDNDGGIIDRFLVMVGGFCHGVDDDWKPGKYERAFLRDAYALDLRDEASGWRRIPDFPAGGRQEMYAATVDDEIHYWGGFNYTAPFTYRDGYKLSRVDGEWRWTRLPDLPRPGGAGNAVAIGAKIYLLGGMDYDAKRYHVWTDRAGGTDRLGSRLYVFDTRDAATGWSELEPCPGTPRMMSGLAAVDGKLWVVGGYGVDREGAARCVVDSWRYDPAARSWERLRDLPVAVSGFGSGSIVYRDRYLLLPTGYPHATVLDPDGGVRPRYGRPSRIDRSAWKQHPGLEGTTYENHVWVYDTRTDLYGTATPLPFDDHGPATHVVGDTAWLFPGETGGFWWRGEYFGHAPELVLRGKIELLDWEGGADDGDTEAILLVDDRDVLYRSGTRRAIRPLRRRAEKPVIAPDRPWESGTIGYTSVHRDESSGRWQLWYQAWTPRHGCHLCYATSDFGRRWEKPSLGLVDFEGSKDNNIVLEIGYGAGVLHDPRDPDPARRYKLAYWDEKGTCVAFSADGVHWKKHAGNPVIRGSYGEYEPPRFADDPDTGRNGPPLSTSDVIDPTWDPLRGVYAIYSKTWLDGPDGTMHWKRAVVRTESRDFVEWTKPRLIFWPDDIDGGGGDDELARTAGGGGSGGVQLHSGPAFADRGRWFSLLQVLEPDGSGEMPIELALSDDGLRWSRPFRRDWFLPPLADKTRFDASLIWSNATPVVIDDEVLFYYGAYGKPWNSSDARQISGVGVATMPRDRYAGVRPIGKVGQVTLRARDLSRVGGIEVNADASKGAVRVELLDDEGHRVRGFAKDDADPVRGDAVRHRVRWRERGLSELAPGKYRLRIHLEAAELFAVYLRGTAARR